MIYKATTVNTTPVTEYMHWLSVKLQWKLHNYKFAVNVSGLVDVYPTTQKVQ